MPAMSDASARVRGVSVGMWLALPGGMNALRTARRVAAAALLLGVAAVAAWRLLGPFGDRDGERRYAVAPATVTDIVQQVTATGTLSAVVTVPTVRPAPAIAAWALA